jgi:thioredoxin reductase (NADPH)
MTETHDLAIIGCGFAGLSAALQAGRSGLRTLVIDPLGMGGQILNADRIENYPGFAEGILGMDLVTAAEQQASVSGVEYGFGTVTGLDAAQQPLVLETDAGAYRARAVLIATGGTRRSLGISGEAELEGRGVSHCATCDGALYADQDVAVIGGGDTAFDEALYLAGMCRSVSLLCRGAQPSALQVLQERAAASDRLEIHPYTVVDAIQGESAVTGLALRDARSDAKRELAVSGVFPCIGTDPATRAFAGVVPMDAAGHIQVDLRMATEVPGVFAAGACRWKSSGQLASAAGDGVTAAIAAFEWIRSSDAASGSA